jgi:hypothetical protein
MFLIMSFNERFTRLFVLFAVIVMGMMLISMNRLSGYSMDEEVHYSMPANMTHVSSYGFGSVAIYQCLSLSFIVIECLFTCADKLSFIQTLSLLSLAAILYQAHNALKNVFFPATKPSMEPTPMPVQEDNLQSGYREIPRSLLSTKNNGGLAILSHIDEMMTADSLLDMKNSFQRYVRIKKKI